MRTDSRARYRESADNVRMCHGLARPRRPARRRDRRSDVFDERQTREMPPFFLSFSRSFASPRRSEDSVISRQGRLEQHCGCSE